MKITRAVIALVATIALTGCATSEEEPTVDSALAAEGDALVDEFTETEMGEELMPAMLKAEYPADFAGVPDADLVDLGHVICGGFDTGTTWEQAVLMAYEAGYSAGSGGALLGASIAAFCPEYDYMFN